MLDVLIYVGAALIVIPCIYTYTASVIQMRVPRLQNKRICLLIAHPDDEAMFFAPTVLALTKPETGNHVKVLCLSSGDAAGLGETRKKELVKSALALGVRHEDDVWVVDRPDFPDSMTTTWEASKISALLSEAFAPANLRGSPAKDRPTAAIDVLITFDSTGVSSHPNHISLYHGARTFLADLMRGKSGWACPVDLYVLTSVSILRKYLSILDIFATLLTWTFAAGFSGAKKGAKEAQTPRPEALLFVNQLVGGGALGAAWGAMTEAHQSQMVWFRWLWILFSRYMVINDLRRETAK
ncbi:hypothetical protein jhhlp_000104 [Lomentospora prolificans]|uniref:N-acetylglucosaminylphosphatidylinositol deacetylase n=1 Tax=Lomentospora prolificans TaxID=41688 RepID=A0A2N3NLL3_9PEZI|nr:hypothetical protein jhhlp_000104 [Lomentospora prolificans]